MKTASIFTASLAALLIAGAPVTSGADELPTLNLVIKNGRFEPETLEAPAAKKFKLVIKNEGPGAEEFESHDLKKEKVLGPGATSFLVFAPLKPGTYKFFGEFHPDTAKGQIVVR